MGLFDYRCAVTGVSLRGADAVLVGLESLGDTESEVYRPCTLGIAGTYDRLGSIEDVTEGLHTELVTAYFHERAQAGDLVLSPLYESEFGNPPRDLEALLGYLERNVNDSSEENPAAALHGKRVFSAFVARPVWTAVASAYAPKEGSPETWFTEVFAVSRAAAQTYRGRAAELSNPIRELAAVDGFLRSRGRGWSVPEGEQHFGSEMRECLEKARSEFADVPAVLAALTQYAADLHDLLHDG